VTTVSTIVPAAACSRAALIAHAEGLAPMFRATGNREIADDMEKIAANVRGATDATLMDCGARLAGLLAMAGRLAVRGEC